MIGVASFAVSAKMNQRIVGVTADDAIVFNKDIGRCAVHNRHSKVVVKTEILRSGAERFLPVVRSFAEPKMPFPESRRVIAAALENIRDRCFVRVNDERRSHGCRPPNSFASVSAKRILTRQQTHNATACRRLKPNEHP